MAPVEGHHQVVVVEPGALELPGRVVGGVAVPAEGADRALVGFVAHVPAAGARAVDLDVEARFEGAAAQDVLGHGASADVAGADECHAIGMGMIVAHGLDEAVIRSRETTPAKAHPPRSAAEVTRPKGRPPKADSAVEVVSDRMQRLVQREAGTTGQLDRPDAPPTGRSPVPGTPRRPSPPARRASPPGRRTSGTSRGRARPRSGAPRSRRAAA